MLAKLVAPVHECDATCELGEERGLFHGGVAAADDRDVLVFEEETVTGGTQLTPRPSQLPLARDAQQSAAGAHRKDHRPGAVIVSSGRRDSLDRTVEQHIFDVLSSHIGSEPKRLLAHFVHQRRTVDPLLEPGISLDLRSWS